MTASEDNEKADSSHEDQNRIKKIRGYNVFIRTTG
jgi:hypothetical protein